MKYNNNKSRKKIYLISVIYCSHKKSTVSITWATTMYLCTTLGLLAIVASSLYVYIYYAFTYWKRKGFPYLEPKIPFGNIERNTHFAIMLENIYKKLKNIGGGPIGGIYLFQQPFAMATDLDFIKRVLITDFQYFDDRGLYYNEKDDPLSAHLLSLRGERWRQLRSKLTPSFTSGKMKFMYPTVRNVADDRHHWHMHLWHRVQ